MRIDVLGCHGGESTVHRTSCFLLDKKVVVDAGAICSMLTLEEQKAIDIVLVSHAHLDHVRDLAPLSDTRCQHGGPPLIVAGTKATLDALRTHFFNDILWPDFTRIDTPLGPTIRMVELPSLTWTQVGDLQVFPVPVNHTIDSSAFLIEKASGIVVYSGDTGPTDKLWRLMNDHASQIKGLMMEVSFPNRLSGLAMVSGHHTPESLVLDLKKFGPKPQFEIALFHIKPVFEKEVLSDLLHATQSELNVLKLGDHLDF